MGGKANNRVSQLAQNVSASPTLSFDALANQKKALKLTAGQLSFNTPDRIIDEATKAAKAGKTKYTPSKGVPELLQSIAGFSKKDVGVNYDPKTQVIASQGAKFALYLAFLATLDKGDEVLVATPYWPTYKTQVEELVPGKLVSIKTSESNGFKLTPELLEKNISGKTKGLILNSPCNPTGSVYSRAELEAIAEIAKANNLLVYSDECYSLLVYEGEHVSIASFPGMAERTLVFNAASKAFSMTGWRMGWTLGPKDIIAAMAKIQSQTTSNPNSVTQYAVAYALTEEHKELPEWTEALKKRRAFVVEKLNVMGLKTPVPGGAFYVFPSIAGVNVPGDPSKPLAERFALDLLEKKNVAVISGAGFEAPENVRISYASSDEVLSKAMGLIAEYLLEIKQ